MHDRCGRIGNVEHYCWRCCHFRSYWKRSIDWRGTLLMNAAFLLPFAVVYLLR
jgi:hypothetical protein